MSTIKAGLRPTPNGQVLRLVARHYTNVYNWVDSYIDITSLYIQTPSNKGKYNESYGKYCYEIVVDLPLKQEEPYIDFAASIQGWAQKEIANEAVFLHVNKKYVKSITQL